MRKTFLASGTLAVWFATTSTAVIAAQTDAQILSPARTIHIKNFTFEPTPLKVHSGDRVTFVNDDSEAHTATAVDKSFDSEALDTNSVWQHAFYEARHIRLFLRTARPTSLDLVEASGRVVAGAALIYSAEVGAPSR